MKLSLQWLQRYVDLSDKSTEELEDALTLIGFEVESIETYGLPPLENVQVGQVLSFVKHPNADKLRLCQVQTAPDEEPRAIVCGASNFKEGDRVMVAIPGAKLPTADGGSFKIKKSKIRGEVSLGMMCSASELGLAESSEGIMILDETHAIGTPVNEVFKDSDTVFDIEVTPNRPDCLSHLGMARELAAYFNRSLTQPEAKAYASAEGDQLISSVEVQSETCPLYYAYSVRGVTIAPSPDWLKKALESVGLRPINNVVDITNYILLETGQPLHAFDAAKIRGGKIVVRQACEGEKITTLDDKERTLTDRMAVIADAQRPLVIAGVMGSVDAEVDDSTVDIVLEAAYFAPSDIRWTSRRLALSTDSSYRFERGVDPHRTAYAAQRCLDMILEIAGGSVSGKPIQVGALPEKPAAIAVKPSFFTEYCGFGPEESAVKKVLERLWLEVSEVAGQWEVSPPSHRRDLERPVDLVEEFLRIYGTDKIPESPVSAVGMHRADAPLAVFNSAVADLLRAQGFCECVHYSLREENEVKQWFGDDLAQALKLTNPLQSDQSHLRPSLLPGLIDALKHNLSHGNDPRALFEAGRVFRKQADDGGSLWELASVAFVMIADPQTRQWKKREASDLFTAKTLAKDILETAGVRAVEPIFEKLSQKAIWQEQHAAGTGCITQEGYAIEVGTLSLTMLKAWDIDAPVIAGEILFAPAFFEEARKRPKFKAYSSLPASTRDLALLVDKWEPAEMVRGDLEGLARKSTDGAFSVEAVSIFDLYEGKGLPEGKKSLALSIKFRADDRTLTEKEVNTAFDKIQQAIVDENRYAIRK